MIDVALFAHGFTHHRKVRKLSNAAFRLWVSAIDHAHEDGTGGLVVQSDVDHFPHAPKAGREREDAIGELVSVGLWDARDGLSWTIHGFDEWRSLLLSLQPAGPFEPSQLAGKPSQLGGAARAAGASRTPAGHFARSSQRPADTPAEHQLNTSQQASRTSSGESVPSPPHPLSGQNEGSDPERASESEHLDQPENKGSTRGRRTRLPADWRPTSEHEIRSQKEGLNLGSELEKFRLHAEGTGRVMANWNAAFTTWLINARRFGGSGRGGTGPVSNSGSALLERVAGMAGNGGTK